ncbi:MAG: hypothetical protein M1120_03435 [Patescibacteria group bacterium]|nr:hypothetical protein [Patescibacteria group bacterium]
MQKILHEKEVAKMQRKQLCLRILFLLVAVLFVLQISLSGILATSGDKLDLLTQRALSLETENENLTQTISEQTSLTNISRQAELMGFGKTKNIIYMPEQTSVALGL